MKKVMKKIFPHILIILISVIIVVAIITPFILPWLTYSPTILAGFPGESNDWFGFWASYSGTWATLLVAFLTWMNNKKMEKLQSSYYKLDLDVNLRLNKVMIVPQIVEKGKLNQYKIIFVFDNMAKNLVHEITVSESRNSKNSDCEEEKSTKKIKIEIGEIREELDILEPVYLLQNGKPTLQICLKIDKATMKAAFAGFYYYFSQFSLVTPKMKMEMSIDIKYGENENDRTTRLLQADLIPTPMVEHRRKYLEFSEEEYAAESYEVLIENYNLESILK